MFKFVQQLPIKFVSTL